MRARCILLGILLLAFALRVYDIQTQSIWGDEAFSIYTAQQEIGYVISGGADTHPPLYHFLLHFWMLAAGRTPLAIRFPSVIWSMLLVAAGYALARALVKAAGPTLAAPGDSRGFAFIVAFLAAVSPFQVFYAQEARMYAQAAALCALSLLFCVRWQRAPGKRNGALWFVTTLLAIYSHYFSFFVLAAENVWLLIPIAFAPLRLGARSFSPRMLKPDSVAQQTSTLIPWFALQAGLALLYVPWVVVQAGYLSSRANARTTTLSMQGVWDVVSRSLGAFFLGTTIEGAAQVALALCFVGLFALGWLASRRAPVARLLMLAIVLPMLGALVFNPLLPHFRERFLLLSSLPFIIFVALGIDAASRSPLWRRAQALARLRWPFFAAEPVEGRRALSLLVIALVSAYVLNQYWSDAHFHKGEYDLAIAAIRASAQPSDAVLIYSPIQDALWNYYHIDGLDAFALPKADLNAVSAHYLRAWLILYGDPAVYDPGHDVEKFLSERGFKSFYQSYRDGALARYDFPSGDMVVFGENRQVRFGDAVLLTGFSLPASLARHEPLAVTLQWQTHAPLSEDYTVFVHLLAADGTVAAQMDTQPAGGTRPTTTWRPGDTIVDRIGVSIPADLPAGQYQVEIGMYLLKTLQRLPVRDAGDLRVQNDAVVISDIDVR